MPCLAKDRTRCPFNAEDKLCPHHARLQPCPTEDLDRARERVAYWRARQGRPGLTAGERHTCRVEADAWTRILTRLEELK